MAATKDARIPLAIGATVWRFVTKNTPDRLTVAGETPRSWVLSDGTKIPKSQTEPVFTVKGFGFRDSRYHLTREAADETFLLWNWAGIVEKVRTTSDIETRRAVAKLIGVPSGVED